MATTPATFDARVCEPVPAASWEGSFLEGLSPALRARMEQQSCTTSYPGMTVIFQEGSPGRGVYIVQRGRPALALSSRSGKRLVLKSARVGDILGLSACLLGKPHAMSLESRSPCTLSFLPKHVFLRLMRADNELCFRVAEMLSAEADQFCRGIDLMGLTRSAEQKLAAYFLHLFVETNGDTPVNGDSLRVRVTHQELSYRVGMARETVTRALRRLACAGALQIRGSLLIFRDVILLSQVERGKRLARE